MGTLLLVVCGFLANDPARPAPAVIAVLAAEQGREDEGEGTGRFALNLHVGPGTGAFWVDGEWTWLNPFRVVLPVCSFAEISVMVKLRDPYLPPGKRGCDGPSPYFGPAPGQPEHPNASTGQALPAT